MEVESEVGDLRKLSSWSITKKHLLGEAPKDFIRVRSFRNLIS